MALKPAVVLLSTGTVCLLAGGGLAGYMWPLLQGVVFWPHPLLWLGFGSGVLLACVAVVLLMLGVQRIVDSRAPKRDDGVVGPLARRKALRSSRWPSDQ